MSIRINLYDFFSYTLPGIFYIIVFGTWLNAFGAIDIDFATLNTLSWGFLILVVATGYVAGLLIDPLAYRWMSLFYVRNRDAAKHAFRQFHSEHPWLVLDFVSEEWVILLRALKSKSLEAAMDVEQHNVAGIMLRNISLSLLFSAITFLVYFLAFGFNIWNLVLCMGSFILSITAIRRSDLRRHWFYKSVFEAYAVHFLLEKKLTNGKQVKQSLISAKASRLKVSRKKNGNEE